ncbi:MAG TPA: hypothetical protein VHZ54_19370 [Solirubrobacterales bacterium]|jgi:hypothetical protein|nr:hypothetical protein [Solirubrobacterales bacterium]
MTSFRWALFGYRRFEVEAALTARDSHIARLDGHVATLGERNAALEAQSLIQARAIASHEADLSSLSGMVIERERTIRDLTGRLEEANAVHDRSIASLDAVSGRLEELQAQARGQATRIRMKALREAVEVSKRVRELNDVEEGERSDDVAAPDIAAEAAAVEQAAANAAPRPSANGSTNGNGHVPVDPDTSWEPDLYEGNLRLEIGPLGDFSQLVGFEETVGKIGATDISVERFSEGRATFSLRLDQPVDLLRELEALSSIDFKVRHTAPDNLILDVDEDGPERHAA